MEGLRFINWNILNVIYFLNVVGPSGRVGIFYDLGQLLLERMLELQMLSPKPYTLNPNPKIQNPKSESLSPKYTQYNTIILWIKSLEKPCD